VTGWDRQATAEPRLVNLAADLQQATGVCPLIAEPLADHTTMRVGGPADLVAVATDVAELAALVRFARTSGLPFLVLGRGSNVVIADAGLRGLVILNRAEGALFDGERLIAEAGLPLARAATLAQHAGLSGLEFGLAIPGTVGGAVWANAGAHGSDVAAVLESVTLLRLDGMVAVEPVAALGLVYRDSRFKHSMGQGSGLPPPAEVILSATFRLSPADPATIKARLAEIRRWRQEHQPLSQPSAGSVFRNPPGDAAGRMIDACGLKGRRVGGAQISEKHGNFIVNTGGATAAHVRRLADAVRAEVVEQCGMELAYEVQFIGDWTEPQQEVV
jgi:UDP-N-acetylmuramate dehydrogenase